MKIEPSFVQILFLGEWVGGGRGEARKGKKPFLFMWACAKRPKNAHLSTDFFPDTCFPSFSPLQSCLYLHNTKKTLSCLQCYDHGYVRSIVAQNKDTDESTAENVWTFHRGQGAIAFADSPIYETTIIHPYNPISQPRSIKTVK